MQCLLPFPSGYTLQAFAFFISEIIFSSTLVEIDNLKCSIPDDAYVIIIGAMKCGTSSLYNYLQSHPEICPAITKEPEYFSRSTNKKIDIDDYSDLWNFNSKVHKYALEASTGYTKYPSVASVPERILEYGIIPKFIYLVRDPFNRIVSHYNFKQREPIKKANILGGHLISTSNYFLQLEQYRKYFSNSNMLVLDFDDLKFRPKLALDTVYNFLDLSPGYYPEKYDVYNPARPVTRAERRLRGVKHSFVVRMIPRSVKNVGINVMRKIGSPIEKRVLTSKERRYIHNELKEDMVKLQNEYGVDVRKWGF